MNLLIVKVSREEETYLGPFVKTYAYGEKAPVRGKLRTLITLDKLR